MSGTADTLNAVDVPRIPDELLAVPRSTAECSTLLAALWDALPDPLTLHIGSDALHFRPTRGLRVYLEATGQSVEGVELEALVPPFGWVLVPWAADAKGVELEVGERMALAERIQDAWEQAQGEQLRAVQLLLWAVQHRRVRLGLHQDPPQESEWLRRQLCHYAAGQEPGRSGAVAARLVAGGWYGTPLDLLATARALAP